MKVSVYLFLIGLILHFSPASAQKKNIIPVKTTVKSVTVFLKGAQVTREARVNLPAGESRIKFEQLSPFVDPQSIRVRGDGNFMITGVRFEHNFKKESPVTKRQKKLIRQFDSINDLMDQTGIAISVIDKQIAFLNKNNQIGGNGKITVNDLQSVGNYYAGQLEKLKMRKWKLEKRKKNLEKEKEKIAGELKKTATEKYFPPGEIMVETRAEKPVRGKIRLTYQVEHAGWYPLYEIHASGEGKDLGLIYKAKVYQQTRVDWKNVQLSISSGNPSYEAQLPKPSPLIVGRDVPDETVTGTGAFEIKGTVRDKQTGEPLPGVNILIKGTSIGTTTDFDGRYKLRVPGPDAIVHISYIGYNPVEFRAGDKNRWNVYLEAGETLQEVVVDISGMKRNPLSPANAGAALSGKVAGAIAFEDEEDDKKEETDILKPRSIILPVETVAGQTSVSFKIRKPYSIPSEALPVSVEVSRFRIPARYLYQTVPYKVQEAFLTAEFTNGEKYKLLPGEAMVFADKTYLGKTLLMPQSTDDTLSISLGHDPDVAVERSPVKDFTRKRMLGNKIIEERQWLIKIKNNKSRSITLRIYDRVPVSNISSVDVEVLELSGGKMDKDTGIVTWTLKLPPGKRKKLRLGYRVKYPEYLKIDLD